MVKKIHRISPWWVAAESYEVRDATTKLTKEHEEKDRPHLSFVFLGVFVVSVSLPLRRFGSVFGLEHSMAHGGEVGKISSYSDLSSTPPL